MGMVACLISISPAQLERLRRSPSEVEEVLQAESDANNPAGYLELDKSWNGIHYLLTGQPGVGPGTTLALPLLGGTEFGEDVGYGPARFLLAEQVREIADALASTPSSVLAARYDPKAMAKGGVYPQAIWVRDGQEALQYVLEHYERMVEFYARAARSGSAVMLWLS